MFKQTISPDPSDPVLFRTWPGRLTKTTRSKNPNMAKASAKKAKKVVKKAVKKSPAKKKTAKK